MKNNFKLSVIVAIFNIEKYLAKCLCSLAEQNYENIEFILVDDGSLDGSSKICDSFAKKDDRFIVIHKKNGGLVSARKKGLEISTGNYIAFVDGDDWVEKDSYSKLMQLLNETEGVDVLEASYVVDDIKGQEIISSRSGLFLLDNNDRKKIIENLLLYNYDVDFAIGHTIWSKLYRRDLIIESYNNILNKYSLGEDVLNYIYMVPRIKKLMCTDIVLYHYVIYEQSLSHKVTKWGTAAYISEIHELCNYLKTNEKIFFSEDIIDSYFERMFIMYINRMKFIKYVFEFSLIDIVRSSNVVLYGAGNVGRDYYNQLCKYQKCNIVAWVDKNNRNKNFEYAEIEPVFAIYNCKFDYIIIAIKSKMEAIKIRNELIKSGIEDKKILWEEPVLKKIYVSNMEIDE